MQLFLMIPLRSGIVLLLALMYFRYDANSSCDKKATPRRAIEKNESTWCLHITKPASKKHFRFRASWPRVPASAQPIVKQRVTCTGPRHYYGASAAPWHREALAHRRLRQRRVVRRQGGSVPLARLVRRACPERTGARVSFGNVDRACQVAGEGKGQSVPTLRAVRSKETQKRRRERSRRACACEASRPSAPSPRSVR